MKNLIYILIALFVISCSGKYKSQIDYDSGESIRVAVLPFVQVDDKDQVIEPQKDFLIDDVTVVSYKLKETPAVYVRKLVQNELSATGLDLLPPAVIESNLSHNGFDNMSKNPPVDADKARKADAKDICTRVVSCDAVLYGKITRWSRSYYGIQSVSSVGIDLKLVSAKDGRVLFATSAEDSDSRGITKGPTGFSNILIEPIAGLDNKIITDLAQKVVKKMIDPLRMQNRPEFLNSSAPAIFASAHDAPGGIITGKDALTVLAFGSSKNTATFSIGSQIVDIPMAEKDSGHYIGKYFPLPNDSFSNQNIYVALTDRFGRTTKQKIGTAAVSLN